MSEQVLQAAEGLAAEGDLRGALALVEQQLEAAGPSPEVLAAAGVLQYLLGETHLAKSRLLQAIAGWPERPEAYRHLGDLLAASGEPDRASACYQLGWQADPSNPAALADLARMRFEQGLPYAARQAAERSLALDGNQPELAELVQAVGAEFPVREVTLYIPCYNAAHCLAEVLTAVCQQTYPIHEILVIDDGSTDESVQVAAQFPVRIVTHGDNRGLSAARNTALMISQTEYVANLDSDVVSEPLWLERLMLRFESERLAAADGELPERPLGGVTGRLNERYDVTIADQWRTIHMAQHHGDDPLDSIDFIYGCNGVYLREAIYRAGGYDERYRTNGEDCDAAERVRGLGYRLAYEPLAQCEHLRRDTVASVLRTIWRYHTPWPDLRDGIYDTGQPKDLLRKMKENINRHQLDFDADSERRATHLLYLSFLGLPYRILLDFQYAASKLPAADRAVVEQSHAAIFLGLLVLLREITGMDDLVRIVHEDLQPCLPQGEPAAAACGWDQVVEALRAARGESRENPVEQLVERDRRTVEVFLRSCAEGWSGFDEMTWNMVRASAFRSRDEAAAAAQVQHPAPRVALVNAPWAENGRLGVRAGSRWPFTMDDNGGRIPAYLPFPFFLATATSLLKREGFDAIIVDAIAEGLYPPELLRRLAGYEPHVVVLEMATASHEVDLDWALRIKERLGDEVQVVVCGPHASALGESLLVEWPAVDAVLLGESEPVLLDLVTALVEGTSLEEIDGLIWRDTEGGIHAQTNQRTLPPMEFYPWPERSTLPMYNYFDSFADAMPWPNVQMHASRGCPFGCIFCVWPQVVYEGSKYRVRDNADIVKEMRFLIDRYGFRAVYFDDDTFNIDNDRIIDLCDRIAAEQFNVPICAMARADTSSQEAFAAMHRAGLVGIKFGVETGDAEMMKRIRKHLDLAKVEQSVQWCHELGIGVHLTFSFGGPGETRETAQKTIDLALELDPESVQFSLMTPFPGTKMFEDAVAAGTLLTSKWREFDGARFTVVRGEYLTREELQDILADAQRQWLLHLTERGACRKLERSRPTPRAVPATGVAGLPDNCEALRLTTPLDRLSNPVEVVAACLEKLSSEGLLCFAWDPPAEGEPAFDLQPLLAWLGQEGIEGVCQCAGLNGETGVAVMRPVAGPLYDELADFMGEPRAEVVKRCRAVSEADSLYAAVQAEVTHPEAAAWLSQRVRGRVLARAGDAGLTALAAAVAGHQVDTLDPVVERREFIDWRVSRHHRPLRSLIRVLRSEAPLPSYQTVTCASPSAETLEGLLPRLAPGGWAYLVCPSETPEPALVELRSRLEQAGVQWRGVEAVDGVVMVSAERPRG